MPIKHAPKESKPLALVFTAVSGVSLGLLLGVAYLLSLPISKASKPIADLRQDAKAGEIVSFYEEGKKAAVETTNLRSSLGRIKTKRLGPVSFSEEELNYFVGQVAAQNKQTADAPKKEEAPEGAKEQPKVDQLNFHLEGDQLFANFRVVLNPNSSPFELRVVTSIDFENTDAGPQLYVKRVWLNALPLPALGGIPGKMIKEKLAEISLPDDLALMWQNIIKVEIESGKLITEVGDRPSAS